MFDFKMLPFKKTIIAAVVMIIPLSGFSLGCNQKTPPVNINQPASFQISEQEKEKLKTETENFVRIYTSYRWGEFRNLEDLKDKTTARLWQEKSRWIETKKQELVNQPKHYLTFSSIVKKTDFISLETNKVEIEIEYVQSETKGASIYSPEGFLIQVDETGQKIATLSPPLETQKKIRLKFIREANKWKVDEITSL